MVKGKSAKIYQTTKKIAELWPVILELYGYHWKMAFLCSEHTSFSGFSDR